MTIGHSERTAHFKVPGEPSQSIAHCEGRFSSLCEAGRVQLSLCKASVRLLPEPATPSEAGSPGFHFSQQHQPSLLSREPRLPLSPSSTSSLPALSSAFSPPEGGASIPYSRACCPCPSCHMCGLGWLPLLRQVLLVALKHLQLSTTLHTVVQILSGQ